MNNRQARIEHYKNIFAKVADKRPSHYVEPVIVPDHWGHPEYDWVLRERQVMLDAVNEERVQRGLEPATIEQMYRIDNLADVAAGQEWGHPG